MRQVTIMLFAIVLVHAGFTSLVFAQDIGVFDKQLLRHVVLVKFKEDLTESQVQEVVDAFVALRGKVESILEIEYGTNISMENKSAGFTHGFVITFADQKGLDDTLPHPAHLEFAKLARARVDDMLMFDYFAKQGTFDIE